MKNSGTPIYPVLDLNQDLSGLRGLTKREYFAAMAMQGLLSERGTYSSTDSSTEIVEDSVIIADKLLKHLENGH